MIKHVLCMAVTLLLVLPASGQAQNFFNSGSPEVDGGKDPKPQKRQLAPAFTGKHDDAVSLDMCKILAEQLGNLAETNKERKKEGKKLKKIDPETLGALGDQCEYSLKKQKDLAK